MAGAGGIALKGAGLAALVAAGPALAQDEGGLRLTFSIEERLEASDNAGLTDPSSGRLTASTTNLAFGLSSETRTQVLRFGLTGGLRFEVGAAVDRFDNPSIDAFYSLTGANSALVLQANAQRSLLAGADPTPDNPDPQGEGSQTVHSASAVLDFGTAGPLGLTLEARHSGTTYEDAAADLFDNRSRTLAATAQLRAANGGVARLRASRTDYAEDTAGDLRRETTDLSLGWTQPLSPSLTLNAEIGSERVETRESPSTDEVTEGLVGRVGLSAELANGTAGLSLARTNDPSDVRTTLKAERALDLGNQRLSAMLGATRRDGAEADMIGSLGWSYDAGGATLSFDLGRTVAADGTTGEVTTDRLTLGVSAPISSRDSLGLSLSASRIDSTITGLVERTDVTASYTRDLGQDWAVNLGATFRTRSDATADTESQLIFLSIKKSFDWRP